MSAYSSGYGGMSQALGGFARQGGMGWGKMMFGPGAGAFWGGPAGMALTTLGLPLMAKALGAGRREEEAFNKWQSKQNEIMSPNWLRSRMGDYDTILQQASQGQRAGILTGANSFQNSLNRNLAASGANRAGVGVLASTAAGSMANNQLMDLSGEIRRGAMSNAFRDRNALMELLSQGPQFMENGWLDAIGRGSNSYMQYQMDRNRPGGY